MLNSVIIGAGIIGKAHLDAYKELDNVNLVAAVDVDIEAGKKNFGDEIPVYGSLEEALANHNIDIADICTPTNTHVELSIKALNAGLHVLCEKPMSKTPEDAALLTAAAEKSDKLFMVAHVVRFMTPYMYLSQNKYPIAMALFGTSYIMPNNPGVKLVPVQNAAAILITIPTLIVFFFCQKQLVADVTAGSIKE